MPQTSLKSFAMTVARTTALLAAHSLLAAEMDALTMAPQVTPFCSPLFLFFFFFFFFGSFLLYGNEVKKNVYPSCLATIELLIFQSYDAKNDCCLVYLFFQV
jgi:hypothetical protein